MDLDKLHQPNSYCTHTPSPRPPPHFQIENEYLSSSQPCTHFILPCEFHILLHFHTFYLTSFFVSLHISFQRFAEEIETNSRNRLLIHFAGKTKISFIFIIDAKQVDCSLGL